MPGRRLTSGSGRDNGFGTYLSCCPARIDRLKDGLNVTKRKSKTKADESPKKLKLTPRFVPLSVARGMETLEGCQDTLAYKGG